jgi:hypothetical protein
LLHAEASTLWRTLFERAIYACVAEFNPLQLQTTCVAGLCLCTRGVSGLRPDWRSTSRMARARNWRLRSMGAAAYVGAAIALAAAAIRWFR